MKTLVSLLAFMAALAAAAQTTNTSATKVTAAKASGSVKAIEHGGSSTTVIALEQPKPNEIVKGKITYSGILVTAAKTGHPLQMVNPLAPPEYGLPEDNAVRDPANGRVLGLKFFALKF